MTSRGPTRMWEDLRREARKLEGELDVKLAAYGKLCSSYDGASSATDKISKQKAAEIESLLQRLSDVNHDMSGVISGAADSRSHTLARHRDILTDLTQEFRRLDSQLGAARDRAELLAGGSENMPLLSVQVHGQSPTGQLLRERTTLSTSTTYVDNMLEQAQSVSRSLLEQRRIFTNVQDKLGVIGEKFPAIGGLLNAIRRRKSKDTLVLSGVIAACLVFTLIYLFLW